MIVHVLYEKIRTKARLIYYVYTPRCLFTNKEECHIIVMIVSLTCTQFLQFSIINPLRLKGSPAGSYGH